MSDCNHKKMFEMLLCTSYCTYVKHKLTHDNVENPLELLSSQPNATIAFVVEQRRYSYLQCDWCLEERYHWPRSCCCCYRWGIWPQSPWDSRQLCELHSILIVTCLIATVLLQLYITLRVLTCSLVQISAGQIYLHRNINHEIKVTCNAT